MFGSVFRFSHLKTAVFWIWGLPGFAGFLKFSLWFSVFVNNEGGFSDFFFLVHFTVFLVLPRKLDKLHPAVAVKPVSHSKGPYIALCLSFRRMYDKPIVYLAAVIWFVT